MPPNEVAEVILGLVQQVSKTVGRSGQSPFEKVSGGTVLECSKTVRAMKQFDDPGPGNRLGNTALVHISVQRYQRLAQKGRGLLKL